MMILLASNSCAGAFAADVSHFVSDTPLAIPPSNVSLVKVTNRFLSPAVVCKPYEPSELGNLFDAYIRTTNSPAFF